MNRLLVFCIGALCGGGAAACVYNCHIVQTKDNWLLVPRAGMSVKDIYADVRNWSVTDWRSHTDLARDMVKAGYAETIKEHAVSDTIDETVDRLTQRRSGRTLSGHASSRPTMVSIRNSRRTDGSPRSSTHRFRPGEAESRRLSQLWTP